MILRLNIRNRVCLFAAILASGIATSPVAAQTPATSVSLPRGNAITTSDRHVIENALIQIHETREVPAQIAGLILSLDVQEGSNVTAGQRLARLDSAEIELALKQAQVEYDVAKTKMDSDIELRYAQKSKQVADAEYQRAVESNRKFPGVVSDTEMDRLRLTIEKNDAEQEKAVFQNGLLGLQSQMALINQQVRELELRRHEIRAPLDGMVVEIKKKDGEWLERSEPIFRIIGLNRLRIEELVPQHLARNDLLGKRVDFHLPADNSAPEQVFNGRVSFVSPEVNPVNHQVKIWIEIENRDGRLQPGLRGRLEIHLE